MNEEQKIERISQLLSSAYRISNKCEDNMKRLNQMMLELKGIVAMVRPRAKKNDWYGDEISATPIKDSIQIEKDNIQIEYESTK